MPLEKNKKQEEKDLALRQRNQALKEKADALFKSYAEARKRYDWEWLTRDLYRRGYHFSRYNPSNRTAILSTRSQTKIPINLVWSQMRVIRNQVTAFRPKWEVLPTGKGEESLNNARYSGKLLDYYYGKLGLRKKLKETITQGLMYSVGGPWQIGYDSELNNGEGDVFIWLLDTYDFYTDNLASSPEDSEACIKAVRRPLDEIRTNPHYTFYENLERGEARIAASEYKQFLLQAIKTQSSRDSEQEDGAIVKEAWMKVRVSDSNADELAEELEKNEQDSKNLRKGEVLMRVVTYIDLLSDPLRVQLLRRSDFPYVLYDADINPLEVYGESWIKHVIPPNMALNALESSIFEYHYKFAKGRLSVPKNSGVRIIANVHGEIVEYNAGANPPTAIAIAPLPASYQAQIQNMRQYIEDIGGAHDVSLGRIPTGVKSGVGIAEMKSADSTNQQDLVDNLEDFLVDVAKKLLKEIAKNMSVPQVVKALGKGGDPQHFAVVGEKSAKERKNNRTVKIGPDVFDLAVIGEQNEIRVTIGSWLAYTKDAQQDKLKEYFEAGLIDQKTFLEHAEFSDVQNIIERTREEELLQKFRSTPAAPGMPSDEEIAQQENITLLHEGRSVQAQPEDNHQVHLIVHQDSLGANGNPLLEEHMAQHEAFLRGGYTQPTDFIPQAPQLPEQLQPPLEQVPMSPEEMSLSQSLGELGGLPL